MKIAEHYSRARNTNNLKSSPLTCMSASDVLGAAGMAAREHADAMMLWGVVYGGNSAQTMALIESLAFRTGAYMMRTKEQGNARHIAMEVIAHYLYAKCNQCDGVGYQTIPGTITRYEDPCPDCGGSGKPYPPTDDAWQWLHAYVAKLLSIAAGRVLQKIDLDL